MRKLRVREVKWGKPFDDFLAEAGSLVFRVPWAIQFSVNIARLFSFPSATPSAPNMKVKDVLKELSLVAETCI